MARKPPKPEPECPQRELHTEGPRGYVAWHAWADRVGPRYSQQRCPGCGLYFIWNEVRAKTCGCTPDWKPANGTRPWMYTHECLHCGEVFPSGYCDHEVAEIQCPGCSQVHRRPRRTHRTPAR
jgi:hypothetical protein